MRFCGPIFIAPGLETWPAQMIDNGTYSLLDTGKRYLLVTCHHVWQAYLNEFAVNQETVLCLNLGDGECSIAFAHPERQLIADNPELDLAVFEFEPSTLKIEKTMLEHQKEWFRIRNWPIAKPVEGDTIALMGFPGKRIQKDGRLCTFNTQLLPLGISGVGHDKIYIFNDSENAEVFANIHGWLGGLSGSPAYTLQEDGAALVGFVKSGYKPDKESAKGSAESPFFGTLILTPAAFLQPDGTLKAPPTVTYLV